MRVVSAAQGGFAAVILAAGASSRLGEPKQLVQVGGERLVERAVRVCLEAGCGPVLLVLGARAEEIQARCRLDGADVLFCDRWSEGMSRSLAVGIGAAELTGVAGALVVTADMPFVGPRHLRGLCSEPDVLRASAYAGRRGVPAYFPSAYFAALMKLDGDAGARELLRGCAAIDLGEDALDIDTSEDLQAALARGKKYT